MATSLQTTTRIWPTPRFWNIVARTAHIVVTAALFGGHVFDTDPAFAPLAVRGLATGAVLVVLEAYPSASWLGELRGLAVVGKAALLLAIPWFWPQRVWLLIAVFVLASAGSHMPRRWRHFSILTRRSVDPAAASNLPSREGRPECGGSEGGSMGTDATTL